MEPPTRVDKLTADDKKIIDLLKTSAAKNRLRPEADEIYRETGLTATRFWLYVRILMDNPFALEYDPTTILRLRRYVQIRRQARLRSGLDR